MKKIFAALGLLVSTCCYSQPIATQKSYSLPITSTDSDDFNDLKAFDSIFASKRILFLGESQHGINDFNLLKYRLIRYLHQQHQFEVVAFESSFGQCGFTNMVKNQLSGMEMLTHSLFGVWRVKGNCMMMDYIRDHQMELAGFDPNNTALDINATQYHFILKDRELASRLAGADSTFLYQYQIPKRKWKDKNIPFDEGKLNTTVQYLKQEYNQLLNDIEKKELPSAQKLIVSKALQARVAKLKTSNNKKDKDYYIDGQQRDQLMASNITLLADSLYKDKKIIIWAHNAHIGKTGTPMINDGISIGDYLPQHIKDQSFIIGLYATSGQYAWGTEVPETIKPRTGSLEKQYETFTSKAMYIPAIAMSGKKYYHGIPAFAKADIRTLYDGVIFIKDVKASKLIDYNKEMRCE